jgi:hypothetical protein
MGNIGIMPVMAYTKLLQTVRKTSLTQIVGYEEIFGYLPYNCYIYVPVLRYKWVWMQG